VAEPSGTLVRIVREQALKRGRSRSVRDLVDQIQAFTKGHNDAAKPFVWAATAQSILEKVERISTFTSDMEH